MSEDDFVLATEASSIPEDSMKLVSLAGRSILLARHDGQVFGVSNRCPHMGCSLVNGTLREFIIICPCHSWDFDIRNGQYSRNSAVELITYECKIQDGKIFVKLMDI
jgi:nitrite reductase/ring-hydroxylating ferredoxin subunit